ncbi:GGDEF domain-containing protein [Cellulomonas marina]|uniref:GGDEF domain-containing protein n=1 Tax=Cellulomonas marina TaxID=988821 RepID=UPI0011133BEC|nr:GGDEF domain-containing protein [Cellulomonas marina]
MDGGRTVQGRRWLRGPDGLVQRTRWLFCGSALLSLALTLPGALTGGSPEAVVLVLTGSVALSAVWVRRYRRARVTPVDDVSEALAALLVTAAVPVPAMASGFAFASLWSRALYGTAHRALLHTLLLAAGLVGSLALWPHVPGHTGPAQAAPLLASLPLALVILFVARHLAVHLFAREQAQGRQEALAALGTRLLSVTGTEEIYEAAWTATAAVCRTTPGLRALTVQPTPGLLVVRGTAGPFAVTPQALPRDALPHDLPQELPGADDEGVPVAAHAAGLLDAAADETCRWLALPIAGVEGWMLLGAPRQVPDEAVVAVRTVMAQVALALRSADARDELVRAARTDPLTGLPNRAAFMEALEEAVGRLPSGASFAVLFCDLHGFKAVNDALGHAAGDALLREVAERFRRDVRAGDLCARLGGDEFAVLLRSRPHDDPVVFGESVRGVGERLVTGVAAPVTLPGGTGRVAVSIGVAVGTAGAGLPGADELLRRADDAMYRAKAGGKGRVESTELRAGRAVVGQPVVA